MKPAALFALLLAGCAGMCRATGEPVPPGAAALGYTKCVIDEKPAAADIAPGKNGAYKWFSGQWYAKKLPAPDRYRTTGGILEMLQGGDIVSMPRDFSKGALPALPGKDGFYVEFEVRITSNDRDHWPAVWVMPVEHNNKQEDREPNDPPGFERWMELDVDEGGFGIGHLGTVLSWSGIWPNYERIFNPNHFSKTPLDRTQAHRFGASYDPVGRKVTWWIDGVEQMSAGAPYVPEIAAKHHYYLIIGAQSHKENKPYSMFVSRVVAYVPPASPLPERR